MYSISNLQNYSAICIYEPSNALIRASKPSFRIGISGV